MFRKLLPLMWLPVVTRKKMLGVHKPKNIINIRCDKTSWNCCLSTSNYCFNLPLWTSLNDLPTEIPFLVVDYKIVPLHQLITRYSVISAPLYKLCLVLQSSPEALTTCDCLHLLSFRVSAICCNHTCIIQMVSGQKWFSCPVSYQIMLISTSAM